MLPGSKTEARFKADSGLLEAFLQRKHTDSQEPLQKTLKVTNHREGWVKTTAQSHPVGDQTKEERNKGQGGLGEIGTPGRAGGKTKRAQQLWETAWRFLEKLHSIHHTTQHVHSGSSTRGDGEQAPHRWSCSACYW